MWSLIIVLTSLVGQPGVGVSHVDSFVSKRLCEQAGAKMVKEVKDIKVQYACVLEIN